MMDFITTYSEFMLNETLKTHDINLTYDNVNRELSLLRFNFSINTKSNKIEITLFGFRFLRETKTYLDLLNNLLIDRHGWYPSEMEITNISSMKNILPYDEDILLDMKNNLYYQDIKITYEAKYDKYLPEAGDSEERALNKRNALIARISARAQAQKKAQGQAGFNVNGIEITKPVSTFKPME